MREFSSLPCPSGTVELKDNNAPDMLHHVQMLNLLLLFIVIDDSLAQKNTFTLLVYNGRSNARVTRLQTRKSKLSIFGNKKGCCFEQPCRLCGSCLLSSVIENKSPHKKHCQFISFYIFLHIFVGIPWPQKDNRKNRQKFKKRHSAGKTWLALYTRSHPGLDVSRIHVRQPCRTEILLMVQKSC